MFIKKRHLVRVVAVVSVCFISAFPVYSYLTDKASIKGTFRISIPLQEEGCEVVLQEHKIVDEDKDGVYTLSNEEVFSNEYKVYPGVNIPKDPYIEVTNLKSKAYLYVEVVGKSSEDFYWSVNSNWFKSNLKGLNGGDVYVYKGNSQEPVTIENIIDDSLLVNILSGIEENSSGGIRVSDNFVIEDESSISLYGYLAQASGFDDYVEAFEGCF